MPQLFRHPYADFLQDVEKPTRYTGEEHGSRRKDWDDVGIRICLAFPEIYDIGMSHLGFRILYKLLNDDSRILAERCYAPWVDMHEKLVEHGQLLLSLESARPLRDFDVVGFSLQFELTYTNILSMLDLGGIPLRSANRGENDPLVIAGGPVATHAEPIAPFIDAFVIGDGEKLAAEICVSWKQMQTDGVPRAERLRRLADMGGIYVPVLYDTQLESDTGFAVVVKPDSSAPFPVERHIVPNLDEYPFPDDGPVGGPEAIFDRMSIEVARGCTEGCRFCQAGMIYRPVRERDPKQVIDTVERALKNSGQDEVSLTALSTADVSSISPMIKRLVEKTAPERVSLGVASLRAYGLADDLLDDMRRVRAQGLTFAPEAGTQRMRDVVNKNVTEAQLMDTAERTFSRGFDKMKLYFMIGLPTEEEEDVRGIVTVGKNALRVGKRVGKPGRANVTVSVSTHVPKPHTPFQWCAMDSLDDIRQKQSMLRDEARDMRALKVKTHNSRTSVLEGVLARGDRSLADAVEHAYLGGATFDSWEERSRLDLWEAAFEKFGIDPDIFLGTIPVGARLPWDHIDVGLEEGFLAREYKKALRSRLSPPCGKALKMFIHHTNVEEAENDKKRLVCYDCGVACDMGKMRSKRVLFLKDLGAETPGQRADLSARPELSGAADVSTQPDIDRAVPQEDKNGPERYRPPRPGSPPERWRIRFEKTGATALLGHLDLMRELPRVIRRSGVQIAYSQGFKPKPSMSFGPALSLGVASLGEYLDIKLIDAPSAELFEEALNRVTPAGLRITGVAKLDERDPNVNRLISGAHIVVAFDRSSIAELGGLDELQRRIDEFLATESVEVLRSIKGLGKKIDVRHYVERLEIGGEPAQAIVERAGLCGDMTLIDAQLRISQNGSAKISELVQCLTGDTKFPHVAVRVELLAGDTTPMDLAAHKKLISPSNSGQSSPKPDATAP
ncbi:MAG: TIGR03960 family B12-binding radical SAM protein [Polyangiaceae bacterium]|nr:TIGR03960 family B12-binding radical SAM protein [Polyangiaceae bacterium]